MIITLKIMRASMLGFTFLPNIRKFSIWRYISMRYILAHYVPQPTYSNTIRDLGLPTREKYLALDNTVFVALKYTVTEIVISVFFSYICRYFMAVVLRYCSHLDLNKAASQKKSIIQWWISVSRVICADIVWLWYFPTVNILI